MYFKKINENAVRCVISEAEIEEEGLTMDDFFMNRKKAQEFLERLVDKAYEEVGYVAGTGMVSMQMMRMPDHNLSITINETPAEDIPMMLDHMQDLMAQIHPEMAEDIMDELEDMDEENRIEIAKDIINQFLSKLSPGLNADGAKDSDSGETGQRASGEIAASSETAVRKSAASAKEVSAKKERVSLPLTFAFDSLEEIEDFAAANREYIKGTSRVYRDDRKGKYYLLLRRGRLSFDAYEEVCQHAMEYSILTARSETFVKYLEEHAKCVIRKDALKILAEI